MSDQEGYSAAAEVGAVRVRRTRMQRIWIDLKKAPISAWFGMLVLVFYAICAIFAPLIAPYGEADSSFAAYAPWSAEHIFGTDQIGRDIFSRLIYGARNTIGIALATTILAFVIGGGLGLIAAINRSWLDQFLSRGVDVLMGVGMIMSAQVAGFERRDSDHELESNVKVRAEIEKMG